MSQKRDLLLMMAIVNFYKKSDYTEENCAAYRCSVYSTDKTAAGEWFLPSTDELDLMYKAMKEAAVSDATINWFWSSTDYSSDYVWYQRFQQGYKDFGSKWLVNSVRAIRAF